MTTETLVGKGFQPTELKLDAAGTLRATIATLHVKDKDGDVTLPGFFGEQNVSILVAHDWGTVPVGKGRVYEDGEKAVLDGRLNLDDANAKTVHSWLLFDLNHGEPIQEWSYGFTLHKDGFRFGDYEGENVRFLTPRGDGSPGAKVHEASLVIVGAGEGTGTQSVKGAKTPISAHSTDTTDRAWNGPRAEASIPSDASSTQLRSMYAWRDPDGDPSAKASYKFVHHHWSDGPGAANVRAAITGIAVLNGARGGTTIPDSEKRGVWTHLAKHIRDAGGEPPELRQDDLSDFEVKYWDLLADIADPTNGKMSDLFDYVLERVGEIKWRVGSLADLRAKEGRGLSEETVEKLTGLRDDLSELIEDSEEVSTRPNEEQFEILLDQTEARLLGRV